MNILVDIDGTTAYGNVAVHIRLCNELLHLAIDQETLDSIQTFTAFEMLPEMQAFKARVEDWKYRHMIDIIDTDPRAAAAAKVMSGACDGVRYLSSFGEIGYCTARSGFPWDDELHEATYQWLDEQQFVAPKNVLFCESPLDKLHCIAEHLSANPQTTILIDDLWDVLLEKFQELDEQEQELLTRHLILGAIWADQEDIPEHPLRIIPLRWWKQVDQFTTRLQQVC